MSLFDKFFKDTWKSINQPEFLSKFENLKSDDERAIAILEIPNINRLNINYEFCGKCEVKCCNMMALGQESDKNNEPIKSLDYYNHALKYAPTESVMVPSLHVARCKVLYNLKYYEDALNEIKIVSSYETKVQDSIQLLILKGDCLFKLYYLNEAEKAYIEAINNTRISTLNNENKAQLTGLILTKLKAAKKMEQKVNKKEESYYNIPQIDYGASEHFSSASGAIELQWTEKRGRRMVAKRDIKMGSVLIVEHPYAWSLSRDAMASYCLHCCAYTVAPLFCPNCCTVIFCSSECRETALQQYHKYECAILNHIILSKNLSVMSLLVYRIIVMTITKADYMKEEQTIHQIDFLKNSVKDLNQLDSKSVQLPFHSSSYSSTFTQITNSSKRNITDIMKRTISATFLAKCLQTVINFPESELSFITSCMLRHLQSCSCNAYEITDYSYSDKNIKDIKGIEIGGAVYPTISLSNHSCNPNVVRHSFGKICVVRAIRCIKKGEEILDNYGPHFLSDITENRQKILKDQYYFECICDACRNNWNVPEVLTDYSKHWKCPYCLKDKGNFSDKICHHCKKKCENIKIKRKLDNLEKVYKISLNNILCAEPVESLKTLLHYAQLLDECTAYPNKQLVYCQQAIDLCWRIISYRHHKICKSKISN